MRQLICCLLFCLPLKNLHLNSGFGHRVHPLTGKYARHLGIDLKARSDTVYSILDGRIAAIAYNPHLGIFIKMAHGPVTITYGHLHTPLVFLGDSVSRGTPIGITGQSGKVTGEHLHLGITVNRQPVDPVNFLYQLINSYHE